MYVIVDDGQPQTYTIVTADNDVSRNGDGVFESRGFLLNRAQLTTFANATKIEMKVGPHEFTLTPFELNSIKEFATALNKELTKIGQ